MSIYKKLFEAKKEIGKLTKDAKNPFFKSNYLSLNGLIDAVEDVLKDHELILMQPIKDNLVNSVIVDITDGSMIESSLALPNIQDPQQTFKHLAPQCLEYRSFATFSGNCGRII